MTRIQELTLIERIRKGNREAERVLFLQYGSRIARKVCYTLGASNEDWKDIAGDIQLAVLKSLREGKFDPAKGNSLGAYIYGITMNKLKDYFGLRKRRLIYIQNRTEGSLTDAVEHYEIEKKELRNMLLGTIQQLKVKYREVLVMRYYEDLSVTEIGTKLNLPPERVSERLYYAHKLLRKAVRHKDLRTIHLLLSIGLADLVCLVN